MRALAIAIATVAAGIGTAAAQQDDCSGFKWPLNRETGGFARQDLPTVASGAPLPGLVEPVRLKLAAQDGVAYAVAPGRKPKHAPAYGGSFALPPIASRDTYQVTISDEAWIDVVQDGTMLKQTGFTGSHSCKTVRKSVRFDLGTGPATIEISDAAVDTLKLEVVPKEQ